MVRPLWTAAVDSCVLTAHISANGIDDLVDLAAFDLRRFTTVAMAGDCVAHLRVEHCGAVVRIDAIADGNTGGHVMRFAVPYDRNLADQIAALDQLLALQSADRHPIKHTSLASKLLPLLVLDQCNAGKSLKMIADEFLGPGDWPGDGEHRKSRIRRLASAGKALVRAGPKDILARR